MSEPSGTEPNAALQRCTTTFKVTLFRSRKTKQVMFLEAGKDFVDTLFNFLVLPMGTIIHILSHLGVQYVSPFGGISYIFESVDSATFLHLDKKYLVQPRPAVVGCTCLPSMVECGLPLQTELVVANIMQPNRNSTPLTVYRCDRGPSCNLFSIKEGARCVECNAGLSPHDYYKFSGGPYSVQRIIPPASKGIGFVKENFKFIVTDKLEIKPSTMITSMSVLKNLEITSNDLESNEATASITQVLLLLHSAVISKTCLNDVFGKECEQ
ncbi:hypothetical protein KC19_12G036700 [Ceratodon purpureus]|uniref:Uncharacterized protein n=1 Tax=Ceratodon purpureus TaxID=3225 RepID=A0A8T0G3W2_CERPU|nr:hypothetical protein KC19_N001500 [Ceratodon purpureus]KAG0553760.1 hypothetical protein KC19_12G036700 [Ceratodon purpureus]